MVELLANATPEVAHECYTLVWVLGAFILGLIIG